MFLGWTYNTWGPGSTGAARSNWMESNMPNWILFAP
jgi:hypothetical protein